MRAIIILALVILAMGLAGWLTLGRNPGRTTINIETEKIQRDTQTAVENTERMIDSGAEMLSGDDGLEDESARSAPTTELAPVN